MEIDWFKIILIYWRYVVQSYDSKEFQLEFNYDQKDLGSTYTKEYTVFKVWAPTAEEMKIMLYEEGMGDNFTLSENMVQGDSGVWSIILQGDLNGTYYTYRVKIDGVEQEVVDPYAKAVGANGIRGMVIDLSTTNPKGWRETVKPSFHKSTDAIIYELHIRDLSADVSSGIQHKGKYLGLAETNTKNKKGLPTGLDHIKELGVTHVHLIPCYDYNSLDETMFLGISIDKATNELPYNWGYDPLNYNALEGSYATDPFHGEVRILEFKQMIQALHKKGIRVIMDMVYNHTAMTKDSNFNKLVPEYYYRTKDGEFTDGSACGNETASERFMMRKFIIDSVLYYATEYQIDGFRFDLMGLHDIETMNAIRNAVDQVDYSILLYGEGWTGGDSPLAEEERALKANVSKLIGVAAFSDDIRDSIKGSVFNKQEKGFVNGAINKKEMIKMGVTGAVKHKQLHKSISCWSPSPTQTINYVSAHDDLTLWDKLLSSVPNGTKEDLVQMNKLAAAIVMTSQGIPFLQAGEEFLRSKPANVENTEYISNSYKSPDSVNSIKWNQKSENIKVFQYYRGLIAFRKAHSLLRMTTATELQQQLHFLPCWNKSVIAFELKDEKEHIVIIYNGNPNSKYVCIPNGDWTVYINSQQAGTEPIAKFKGRLVQTDPISCLVLVRELNDCL